MSEVRSEVTVYRGVPNPGTAEIEPRLHRGDEQPADSDAERPVLQRGKGDENQKKKRRGETNRRRNNRH